MPKTRLLAVPLAAALLAAGAGAADAVTLDRTSSVTCRGKGIDPRAKLHHRTQILIKAPLRTVWNLHADVERWPSWQEPVTSAKRLDRGPLRKGSKFRWTTPAPATPATPATTLVITSTVKDLKRGACIRWSGPAVGEGLRIDQGVHVWNFTEVKGGVLVRTEESWTGSQIEADPQTSIKYLAPGLDLWLTALKSAAEARSGRK
ncbi:SRPBCC family protein [Actinomadura sp. ATCC 31491]|uniref:SRPBCC family protein n=1 Tax=Actinomadura luzonensis TaxID=2805427 RepID=A0ABT0G206_9ACTN|nr:SRPBCC family protein [Actinomadura luzonensis]MCK2218572.1 SRPBCC family protein [Actinomadura luzonensis]